MEITRRTRLEELPEFVHPRELARFWGVGASTVYDRIGKDLKAVRFGRRLLIPRSEIERLVKA